MAWYQKPAQTVARRKWIEHHISKKFTMHLQSQLNYAKASLTFLYNKFVHNLLPSTAETHEGVQFRDNIMLMT